VGDAGGQHGLRGQGRTGGRRGPGAAREERAGVTGARRSAGGMNMQAVRLGAEQDGAGGTGGWANVDGRRRRRRQAGAGSASADSLLSADAGGRCGQVAQLGPDRTGRAQSR
jgi:hypothetical protein